MTDERQQILQNHKKIPEGGKKEDFFSVIVQKINKAPLRGGAADNKQIISVFTEHIVWQAEHSQRL